MADFTVVSSQQTGTTDPFERQKRIAWWDQSRISGASVLVAGAGALGNETIKNLMLLGFRKLLICDFDTVEDSNLSRAPLFRKEDVGKQKAKVAAERAYELALIDGPEISWFHGDIVAELGLGVFEQFDVVLGCLDNIEARMHINRCCRRVGTPWIDSGINELSGHVMAFAPDGEACYECGLSSHQLASGRQRYACGQVKRMYFETGKVATVQVTSSIIAGLLVQECLKVLCDAAPSMGRRLHYHGLTNELDTYRLRPRAGCPAHVALPPIHDLDITRKTSLSNALAACERVLGSPVTLDLRDQVCKGFVRSGRCSLCDRRIAFHKPVHALFDVDLFCDSHTAHDINDCRQVEEPDDVLAELSNELEPAIRALSLAQLGIPAGHILTARRADGVEMAVRLSGDLRGGFATRVASGTT